jgi:hypothetical protein
MIAVKIMAAETGIPLLARDQVAVRDVERIAPELEVLVAGDAGGGGHGDPYAGMLAMAGRAGVRAELGASLRESRLKEAMDGMRILFARMAIHALRVAHAGMAERNIPLAPSEPELDLRLDLLAHGSRRLPVAIGAGERRMAGVGRPFGKEARRLRHHRGPEGRHPDDGADEIGRGLDRASGRSSGGGLRHVSTTAR